MKYVNASTIPPGNLRGKKLVIKIGRDWYCHLAAFFLGLVVCGEIFDVFTINNTYVEVPHIYALILLAVCLLRNYKEVFFSFQKYCIGGLKLYTAVVLLLVIPGMLRFINTAWVFTPLKGAIMYMALFAILLDVLIFRNYKADIINGVLWGFGLNLLYAAIQFVLYQAGQNYVLLQWLTDKEIMYINGIFRAEGFFTEPSHYWLYLVTFFPLLLSRIRASTISVLLMLFVLFLFSYTVSGGVYAIIICCVLYCVFVSRVKEHTPLRSRKFHIQDISVMCLILFLFIAIFSVVLPRLSKMGFGTYVLESLSDLVLSDKNNGSTQQRFSSILAAAALLPKYWLGSGYGMASPIIQESYHMRYYVASFSYPLTCILETGVIGLLGYLLTIYTLGVQLIRKSKNVQCRAFAVGCLMCFIGQALTGRVLYPYMMLLFGLTCLEYADTK